jgi:hypothetical protein
MSNYGKWLNLLRELSRVDVRAVLPVLTHAVPLEVLVVVGPVLLTIQIVEFFGEINRLLLYIVRLVIFSERPLSVL